MKEINSVHPDLSFVTKLKTLHLHSKVIDVWTDNLFIFLPCTCTSTSTRTRTIPVLSNFIISNLNKLRGCIQKFQDWPPGTRNANGTAPCH